MSDATFDDKVVFAISKHMNDDHPEDSLIIVRGLADRPEAVSAKMTDLDATGADYLVTGADGTEETVRVPWATTLTERAQIRKDVVRQYDEACAKLGLPGRDPNAQH